MIHYEDRPGVGDLMAFLHRETGHRFNITDAIASLLGPDLSQHDPALSVRYNEFRFVGDKYLNAVVGDVVSRALLNGQCSVKQASEACNYAVSRDHYGRVYTDRHFVREGINFLKKQPDVRNVERPPLHLCGERLEAIAGALFQKTKSRTDVEHFGREMLERSVKRILHNGVKSLEERVRERLCGEGVPHKNGAAITFQVSEPEHRVHVAHLLFDGLLITTGAGPSVNSARRQALKEALSCSLDGICGKIDG